MNFNLVERVVNAVLYEGYMLYPYRPSAIKNRQRWNFGVLYPQAYSLAQRASRPDVDAWSLQTECLVQGDQHTLLNINVRCLHLLTQDVCAVAPTQYPEEMGWGWRQVETLEVDEQLFHPCQEASESAIKALELPLGALVARPQWQTFTFPASQEMQVLRDSSGQAIGALVRRRHAVTGALEVVAAAAGEHLFTLTVRILNLTPLDHASAQQRDAALLHSLVSTHTILQVYDGAFLSLLEPPAEYRLLAASCQNIGTWPVLVGEAGERDCLLSAPMILYDYPQVAPESSGDLFDATEIDELLTLRILTLTEAEKREMGSADARTRQILERTAALPMERLRQMHGVIRNLRPLQGE